MKVYDVIIIGAGPAGLTAAIYASRRELKTLVLSKDLGGQAVTTEFVENYPGFGKIGGLELMQKFEQQAKDFGVDITYEAVTSIKEVTSGREFLIKTSRSEYSCSAIILAFGKIPRRLNVPGEEKYLGRGVSYCATCDGPLFKNKIVAVIGGGNSGVEAALYMSKISSKVYLLQDLDKLTAFENSIKQVNKEKNIEVILNAKISEFRGQKMLDSIVIEDVKNKKMRELKVAGAFEEIGWVVDANIVKNFVKLDKSNHVITNERCETYHPDSNKLRSGIFAAGDVTHTPFKQIVISAGEGAKAALQAYEYLQCIKLGELECTDWDTRHTHKRVE
jgi:thioredoxin reductase (NADPH)